MSHSFVLFIYFQHKSKKKERKLRMCLENVEGDSTVQALLGLQTVLSAERNVSPSVQCHEGGRRADLNLHPKAVG